MPHRLLPMSNRRGRGTARGSRHARRPTAAGAGGPSPWSSHRRWEESRWGSGNGPFAFDWFDSARRGV